MDQALSHKAPPRSVVVQRLTNALSHNHTTDAAAETEGLVKAPFPTEENEVSGRLLQEGVIKVKLHTAIALHEEEEAARGIGSVAVQETELMKLLDRS